MVKKSVSDVIVVALILHFAFCILHFSTLYAGDYGAEFLSLGAGARALGLGGAFVGIADDSTAAYWNPAGLGQLEKREIGAMYESLFDGKANYMFGNVILPLGGIGTIGVTVIGLQTAETIEDTRALFNEANKNTTWTDTNGDGFFNEGDTVIDTDWTGLITKGKAQDLAFLVSYARSLDPEKKFCLGANVKIISQSVFEYTGSGFGLDLGLLYKGLMTDGEGLSIGLMVEDIGTSIAWNTNHTDSFPMNIRVGVAQNMKLNLGPVNSLILATGLDTRYGLNMHYGCEVKILEMFSVRAGIKQVAGPQSMVNNVTLGAGYRLMNNYSIDLAYIGLMDNALGNSLRASVSLRF